jgi:hypothetical protein
MQGRASGKTSYDVKFSAMSTGTALKMKVKTAHVGVRNADGKPFRFAGFMPFVKEQALHVAMFVGDATLVLWSSTVTTGEGAILTSSGRRSARGVDDA